MRDLIFNLHRGKIIDKVTIPLAPLRYCVTVRGVGERIYKASNHLLQIP